MKRILLVCTLFIAVCTAALAQTAITHPVPTPVSKPDFVTKVVELNTLLNAGNVTAANAKWTEIAQLVNNEMTVVRYKIQDAVDAHNDVDKAHYQSLSQSQRSLYAQTLQLKTADIVANKTVINQKLTAFADSII